MNGAGSQSSQEMQDRYTRSTTSFAVEIRRRAEGDTANPDFLFGMILQVLGGRYCNPCIFWNGGKA